MELFVIAILLSITGAQESQMKGPENTLSAVSSTVTLKCSSPTRNCSGIDWQKYVLGASPMTLFKGPGQFFNTVDRDRYSVDNSSGCDLVIRNVQLTDAGRFICAAIFSSNQHPKTAYLIILETQPKCSINATKDITAEGDGVQLKCEVTYNGTNCNNATMGWKGVTDASAAVKSVNITISRSYSVVASAPEVPPFTCETLFAVETVTHYGESIYGMATNSIPKTTCSTPAIKVLYSVREVTLSPVYSNYPPGTIITCAAKGNPSPNFKWQENEDNDVWMDIQNQKGSQFAMSNVSSKKYRCAAMNVVRTKSYNANSFEFHVKNTDAFSTTTISSSEGQLGFNAGVGLGIGIGFIVAILLASIAIAMLVRHKYIELHPNPAADGVVRHHGHEMSSAAVDRSTPRTGTALVGEKDSTYASLREGRDDNEYASLEQRQKAKPKKKSRP